MNNLTMLISPYPQNRNIESAMQKRESDAVLEESPQKKMRTSVLSIPTILQGDPQFLHLQDAVDGKISLEREKACSRVIEMRKTLDMCVLDAHKINVVHPETFRGFLAKETEWVEQGHYAILEAIEQPSKRFLATDNLKSCVAVVTRYLGKEEELLAIGLAHDDGIEGNPTGDLLRSISPQQLSKIELFIIGGNKKESFNSQGESSEEEIDEEATIYEMILNEIEEYERECKVSLEVVAERVNVYNVNDATDKKYGQLCYSPAHDLVGYSLSVAVTRKGELLMAKDSLLPLYDADLLLALSMLIGRDKNNNVGIYDAEKVAAHCVGDPEFQQRLLRLLTDIFIEDGWIEGLEYDIRGELIVGIQLFLETLTHK